MNQATQRILVEVNRRFYEEHAQDFATSRHHPWEGWGELLEPLKKSLEGPIRVLDAGCGNGRFGDFLAAEWPAPIHYTGIDSSESLLTIARARLKGKAEVELRLRDLLEAPLSAQEPAAAGLSGLGGAGFDLAVTFGVLHHVPGKEQRRELLEGLAAHLAPGGFLACSIWLFGREERFRRRLAEWSSLDPDLGAVDPSQLEEGDYLLRWGLQPKAPEGIAGPAAVRYCHALSGAEEREWIEGLGLDLVLRYEADGRSRRLNRYLLFRRSGR